MLTSICNDDTEELDPVDIATLTRGIDTADDSRNKHIEGTYGKQDR